MSSISPKDGFDYCSKASVLPSTLKGRAIIAGGLFAFNFLVDKPVVGDVLVGYRRATHRFFRFVGGKNFNDRQMLDAGAMSLVDGISLLGFSLFAGRLGLVKGKPTPTNIQDIDPNKGLQK